MMKWNLPCSRGSKASRIFYITKTQYLFALTSVKVIISLLPVELNLYQPSWTWYCSDFQEPVRY
jgi:hypothetical protein